MHGATGGSPLCAVCSTVGVQKIRWSKLQMDPNRSLATKMRQIPDVLFALFGATSASFIAAVEQVSHHVN